MAECIGMEYADPTTFETSRLMYFPSVCADGKYVFTFADKPMLSLDELLKLLATPSSERHFQMYEALRKGATDGQIFDLTGVKAYFVRQMRELVEEEEEILQHRGAMLPDELLIKAKKDGFSDKYLAQLLGVPEKEIRERRKALGVVETWHKVPVSGVENAAYYYSSYNGGQSEVPVSGNKKKVLILGGGPNRIGQGIEFDYCCVHTAMALREAGYETIMVNCNPETVSTDYDTSDKLYFEPVTLEDVLQIYEAEKPLGVIVQFGGQTPLNLARGLADAGCNVLGTPVDSIEAAEDRDQFHAIMDQLGIPMPESRMAANLDEAIKAADEIGYPLVIRPSFVLGGRGMEVIYDEQMLREYVAMAVGVTPDRPLYIDRFLHHALECEADAICDGPHAYVPAVMEHIELAGIHSGDSACILPSKHISDELLATIKEYTRRIAVELHVVGLMNMQYAIEKGVVYVLEANPRASRTVPLVSKVCGISMVPIATDIITGDLTGRKSPVPGLNSKERSIPYYGVKEAVFPFNMFQEVDPLLGPEMRSTGEVLGISHSASGAFYKAQEAAGSALPLSGTVLISVNRQDKSEVVGLAKLFADAGFSIMATGTTCDLIANAGIPAEKVKKLYEGRPNIQDLITNGKIDLIINTPSGKSSIHDDSYLRKSAIKAKIPFITTMAAGYAAAEGIAHVKRHSTSEVNSLQTWHGAIREV